MRTWVQRMAPCVVLSGEKEHPWREKCGLSPESLFFCKFLQIFLKIAFKNLTTCEEMDKIESKLGEKNIFPLKYKI